MPTTHNALSMNISQVDDRLYLSFSAKAKVTHADYKEIIPDINQALDRLEHPKVIVFIDATKLEALELKATCGELRFDPNNVSEIERVAIVGSKRWHEELVKVSNCFKAAQTRYFSEAVTAEIWLYQEQELLPTKKAA